MAHRPRQFARTENSAERPPESGRYRCRHRHVLAGAPHGHTATARWRRDHASAHGSVLPLQVPPDGTDSVVLHRIAVRSRLHRSGLPVPMQSSALRALPGELRVDSSLYEAAPACSRGQCVSTPGAALLVPLATLEIDTCVAPLVF